MAAVIFTLHGQSLVRHTQINLFVLWSNPEEERDETPQFQEQSDISAAKATGQL